MPKMTTEQLQSCNDDASYVSKIGLACAQHELIDCHGFADVGFTTNEVQELLRRCPNSCRVPACDEEDREDVVDILRTTATATATMISVSNDQPDNRQILYSQQERRLQYPWAVQGRSIGGDIDACFPGWDASCQDDPKFLAEALLLPCESFQLLECIKLDAIGFNERQVFDIVGSCPCSCKVECGAWTLSPTPGPTNAPTISHQPSAAPTFLPTSTPSASPSATPTLRPSHLPTVHLTFKPSRSPTTETPTEKPSEGPTPAPSMHPTFAPSLHPTHFSTANPTFRPTSVPIARPSDLATARPSPLPSHAPFAQPTTHAPTISMQPTTSPSVLPSAAPTISSMPTSSEYWAAATIWQENKEGFMSIFIIFGAAAATLAAVGVFSAFWMKKSRAQPKRNKLLKGMGYTAKKGNASSGGSTNGDSSKKQQGSRRSQKTSSHNVEYVEPNIRSNNAGIPKYVYDGPTMYDQPAAFDDLDALADDGNPATGWLDNYALRHQKPVIRRKYTDDFATLGSALSSASTLNTKSTKTSNGTAHGSVIVFESRTSEPKADAHDKNDKQDKGSLLEFLPFVGRDRPKSRDKKRKGKPWRIRGESEIEHKMGRDDIAIESINLQKSSPAKDEAPTPRTRPSTNDKRKKEDRRKKKETKDSKPVFIPVDNKNPPTPALSVDTTHAEEDPVATTEAASNGIQLPSWLDRAAWVPITMFAEQSQKTNATNDPRTAQNAQENAAAAIAASMGNAAQWTSSWLAPKKQDQVGQHTQPVQQNADGTISSVAIASDRKRNAATATATQQQWSSWLPKEGGDIDWNAATAKLKSPFTRDVKQGSAQTAAAGESNHFAFPQMRQMDWPAWMAPSARQTVEPPNLTEARQQSSIMPMSPTTEDGLGFGQGDSSNQVPAFHFKKHSNKAVKWLKGNATSSVKSLSPKTAKSPKSAESGRKSRTRQR